LIAAALRLRRILRLAPRKSSCPDIRKLGKNCAVEDFPHPPNPSGDRRVLGRDGIVEVREYRCAACARSRPQADQFGRASIAIVRSGVFAIRSDRGSHLLTSGFLLLGNPGQHYEASHDHAGGDRCLVFSFRDRVLQDLADSIRRGVRRDPFDLNVLPPLPRADALRLAAEDRMNSDAPAVGLEEIALALAAYVLGEAGAGSPRVAAPLRDDLRTRERILAVIAQIQARAERDLSLADLSESARLSPYHLLRTFKRVTGVTPYRFLLQTRIRNAIEMLRDTSAPVTSIAYDAGFGDLSNFINAFRREVGCSPRQYRNAGPPIESGSKLRDRLSTGLPERA
jgi:AraC family transcriptional regulator